MRTTLNLDDDVVRRLADLARQTGRSLSRVANEALRAGFRSAAEGPALPPYEPPVLDTGRALIDVTDVAQALDLLDDD